MRRSSRIALVIVGAVVGLIGFAMSAGGAVLVWAHATQRDAAGFYTTPTKRFTTSTYALISQVDFGARPGERDWVPFEHIATVRLKATAADQSPLFMGIGPQADVDQWLAGRAHEKVTSVSYWPFHVHTQRFSGSQPSGVPASQTFWVVSTVGPGTQTLTWPVESGRWAVVVMNADGRAGIAADVQIGAKTGYLLPIGIGLGVVGLVLLAGGVVLILVGSREEPTAKGPPPPAEGVAGWAPAIPVVPPGPAVPAARAYPVRLEGQLDAGLNRWLWLVKWILAIPHLVVLAFLWIAFAVLTFVAGVAILFTGRYPRSIFDFNVGVMRWTWRVGFYAFSALGTDRYPPFTLEPDPTYPAELAVDYPEQLSRGLVLVKWWLLAIPHYLVVGFFAGGGALGWNANQDWRFTGGGLIGLLVLIAVITLAVSGHYPQPLFDFVMGMNRWCFRVLAYAGLMRDEYPPFRLDTGGADPGGVPAGPPPAAPDQPGLLVGAHPTG